MSQSACPPGASWVSPYIAVRNIDAVLPFYQKAFGFKLMDAPLGEDGSIWHAEFRYQGQLLMFGKAGAYDSTVKPPVESGVESPINLYLYCEDVDAFYAQAVKAGAVSLAAPEPTFWGDKMCRLQDPDGYLWCFATRIKTV